MFSTLPVHSTMVRRSGVRTCARIPLSKRDITWLITDDIEIHKADTIPSEAAAFWPSRSSVRSDGAGGLSPSSTVSLAAARSNTEYNGLTITVPPKLTNAFDASRNHIRCLSQELFLCRVIFEFKIAIE